MTYEDLLGMAQRAVHLSPGDTSLHDCMIALTYRTPANRGIAAEKLAMLLVEYIEQSQPKKVRH